MLMNSKKPNFCHYYNNGNNCPYQDIGCMFLHERAGRCNFRNCKKVLCQYQHEEEEYCEEIVNVSEADEAHEEFVEIQENDGELVDDDSCHLCGNMFLSQDALIEHMKTVHIDIFVKMAESNQFSVEV